MLRVLHECGPVGVLSAQGRELHFVYDVAWLDAPGAFPLSPRLPLGEAAMAGEEVLVFFANLLPEGALLDTLCRLRQLPRGNVYRLLEAFGRETAGAFELVPEGDVPRDSTRKPLYEPLTPDRLAEDLARLRDNLPLLHSHGELRLSLAGAQNKMPVACIDGGLWLPRDGAPSTHILKPALQPEARYPDAVLNEAACLRLGGAIGLSVPETQVLMHPAPMLLIARYDRRARSGRMHRLHQLDLCQLGGVLPDQKYESDGGPGFAEAFAAVDRHSAAPATDRLQLVDWLIFNFLIGNADAHGKNVSMLYHDDGRLRLAPTYDLLSLTYWPELSTKMAMAIGGERRPEWVMARHWQRLCDAVGLNVAQLRKRALMLAGNAVARLPAVLDSLGEIGSERFAASLDKTLTQRGEWIAQRLGVDT